MDNRLFQWLTIGPGNLNPSTGLSSNAQSEVNKINSHLKQSCLTVTQDRYGPLASHPSLLWQQLSVGCPDLLFARGMVAICWRLNLSVPVFQIDRYA